MVIRTYAAVTRILCAGPYDPFNFLGHGAGSCVEQTTCNSPDPSCTTETVHAAQQTTCETACKDKSSCQMYMVQLERTGNRCNLYSCQRCHTIGKKHKNGPFIYFCSPGNAQQTYMTKKHDSDSKPKLA